MTNTETLIPDPLFDAASALQDAQLELLAYEADVSAARARRNELAAAAAAKGLTPAGMAKLLDVSRAAAAKIITAGGAA